MASLARPKQLPETAFCQQSSCLQQEVSLAEILQDSRPSGPKPAPGLALGLVPLISQTRPTTTEGTLNKQSNRLTLPSSGSVWHCVRPQAMLDSLTRVNLQPVPLKSQDWAKKTPSLNPPHYSEASWPAGGQHGERRRQLVTSETHASPSFSMGLSTVWTLGLFNPPP